MGGSLNFNELEDLYKKYPFFRKIKNFIETGTYKGDTSIMASSHFEKVFTMEIVEKLFQESKSRAEKEKIENIQFFLGDSLQILPKILTQIDNGAIFFIDAHQSGPDTSNNKKQLVPLFEELDIIISKEIGPCVFIFDDVRFWKNQNKEAWDWAHISTEKILSRIEDKKEILDYYLQNDRFFVLTS